MLHRTFQNARSLHSNARRPCRPLVAPIPCRPLQPLARDGYKAALRRNYHVTNGSAGSACRAQSNGGGLLEQRPAAVAAPAAVEYTVRGLPLAFHATAGIPAVLYINRSVTLAGRQLHVLHQQQAQRYWQASAAAVRAV
jgi:hypothetical protein